MHSLTLSILRRGNQLGQYPSDPVVLDGWEQQHVYDAELAGFFGCTPSRAKQIREARFSKDSRAMGLKVDVVLLNLTQKRAHSSFDRWRNSLSLPV